MRTDLARLARGLAAPVDSVAGGAALRRVTFGESGFDGLADTKASRELLSQRQ